MEGLGRTQKGAPFHLLGLYDSSTGDVRHGIGVPKLLSLLADHDPNATVQGLDAVPKADRTDDVTVNIVRYTFQAMIGIGTAIVFLGRWFLVLWWRSGRPPRSVWFYRAVVVAGPATVVALIAGWVTTEVGRQPWIVTGSMRSTDAVTDARGLTWGLTALWVVYAAVGAGVVWLLRRLARSAPESELPA